MSATLLLEEGEERRLASDLTAEANSDRRDSATPLAARERGLDGSRPAYSPGTSSGRIWSLDPGGTSMSAKRISGLVGAICLCAALAVDRVTAEQDADFRDTFTVDKARLADRGAGTYFILEPGYALVLEDGKDTLTITVLDETKVVDGVRCRIVVERETKGGKLEEVSRNYFAIDEATGDAYYFGEDVDMYDWNGKITGHEGSWLSGVNGATFGLLLPGQPTVGARYQQESAPRVAMDRAEVVSITEDVKVPAGTFAGCLKTKESSGLESDVEVKLYAPRVGLLKDGAFKLVRIEKPK
jgi:hypothetical protein